MCGQERATRIAELQHRLEELDARFQIEAQRRGFDPAQIDNMALPTALAKLLEERGEVKSELQDLAVADYGERD